jgi:hypothetical protein
MDGWTAVKLGLWNSFAAINNSRYFLILLFNYPV